MNIDKDIPTLNEMKRITCPIQGCKCVRGRVGKLLGFAFVPRGSPKIYTAFQCPKNKSKWITVEVQ
ncbi:MAG: hypothetical protein ISR95_02520 [Candidatus Marinimicrobia bacterium]|nr:hypothetical protein [Candidatus Neomarinimicrobiota bacterium]